MATMRGRWVDNTRINFGSLLVLSFTGQGGLSPEGLRVLDVKTGRTGTITDGPHCTYGCTVRFDDNELTQYVDTGRLAFLGDGRGNDNIHSGE